MSNSRPTQVLRLIDYLMEHKTITKREARDEMGIVRLPSRICELRKMGYPITGKLINVKNRYGENCRIKQYTLGVEVMDDGRTENVCKNNH